MAEQETLFGGEPRGEGRPPFNPADHGLWARYVDGDGSVNHAAWLRARATREHVGTCRECGNPLRPEAPYDAGGGRTAYEATCVSCARPVLAPAGKVRRSARKSGTR